MERCYFLLVAQEKGDALRPGSHYFHEIPDGHTMKGFVPTPETVVDRMLDKLFADGAPAGDSRVLDPGAGRGAFVDGVIRWCRTRNLPVPRIAAVESDPAHIQHLRARFSNEPRVAIVAADFLSEKLPSFDFVVGNPPYVAITGLSQAERISYRRHYSTAHGRFDLYILFFERALRLLKPGGRLVFITPEKFLYVETAAPLRELLSKLEVIELEFVDENIFPGLVTYPLITTIQARSATNSVSVVHRDGSRVATSWSPTKGSWLPLIHRTSIDPSSVVLGQICSRISCGVATGADSIFVVPNSELVDALRPFAHPTIAGREINGSGFPQIRSSMLLPYDDAGSLLPERDLGSLGAYLKVPERRARLLERTCAKRKPWYAFHETPPLRELLTPKILCKDIAAEPTFVVDEDGAIVPRHSVYYIIPSNPAHLFPLYDYLRSDRARKWLRENSQRASKGFLRMQSHVLKALPVPSDFAVAPEQLSLRDDQDVNIRRSA